MPERDLHALYFQIFGAITERTGFQTSFCFTQSGPNGSSSVRWNLGPSQNPVNQKVETYWVQLFHNRFGDLRPTTLEGWIGFRLAEGQCASFAITADSPVTDEEIEHIIDVFAGVINHAVETGCAVDLNLFAAQYQPH